jgi:hypothetical protein
LKTILETPSEVGRPFECSEWGLIRECLEGESIFLHGLWKLSRKYLRMVFGHKCAPELRLNDVGCFVFVGDWVGFIDTCLFKTKLQGKDG